MVEADQPGDRRVPAKKNPGAKCIGVGAGRARKPMVRLVPEAGCLPNAKV
ncbi:hypothetical protein AFE_1268 [Acidithiobacillus ferrooxidans ATCC 23270]|uniref:Uncharacterized protein n=1 Tax=Acidithiobacillus ferrooxidans (strain ATCC 23270 / DSM 14882 / CIP 104768 / NCIMB 8455) TaxID=243159 RepID=B7J8V1_ACIF2|nr:hypothetical protein AFE_1268 [Acidithiobacillus ferrooxidans ATCC 23270]